MISDYFVIDAHVHTFKTPEIGIQALSGFDAAGCCGTPEELVPIMKDSGISLAVQCNMTPAKSMYDAAVAQIPPDKVDSDQENLTKKVVERIIRRNQWTCQMAHEHERLVPLLSLDPIMGRDKMLEELLDKLDNFQARGLKIHPGEGHFFPDHPWLLPVYEILEKRGLPVISHGGTDVVNPDPNYTRPGAFGKVAENFPGLKLVIAHLGRGFFDESVETAGRHPNIFFDTSAAIPGDENGKPLEGGSLLSNEQAVQLIREIGVDRVMFGTDYPWFHPKWDLKRFMGLDFGKEEREALLGGNARRVFDI